ncbi:MAG: hypothetical protein MSA68_00590 [Helicobacter sp.]|nr:hypothetical protein [Helicobacter sp.]
MIDDSTFIHTLFQGKQIPLFILPDIGRFFPLDGQDINILSALFGTSASVFYAFNACCVVIVVLCLFYAISTLLNQIDSQASKHKCYLLTYVLLVILLLSPSFITSFLRLFVPERMEFVFFSLFLGSYAFVLKHPFSYKAYIAIICGVISANLALYYKETGFAMLMTFGIMHLLFGFKISSTKTKIFDTLLVLSSIIWVIVYISVVVLEKNSTTSYGDTPYNQLIVVCKITFNYILNEPFLFIALPLALIYRISLIHKSKFHPLFDSSLLSALVLMGEYLVLRIGDVHYVLIAYVFGLIALGSSILKFAYSRYFKTVIIVCGAVFLLNSLPFALWVFMHYKVVPNSFQESLEFLSDYIKKNPHTNIYLEGVNRASGVEVYHSFGSWLGFYGASGFDLRSDLGIDNTYLATPDSQSPYSVFRSNNIIHKHSGDLVVLSPYSTFAFDKDFLATLDSKYELLFTSTFGYNFPKLGIKSLLKQMLSSQMDKNELMLSHNYSGLPLKFYVYRVR